MNSLSHRAQGYGLSPEWLFICILIWFQEIKSLPHRALWYVFSACICSGVSWRWILSRTELSIMDGEVVAALLINFKPFYISGFPCWMAREARPAGPRVGELEGSGWLGQQGRAVKLRAGWPGRLDQQGRYFDWLSSHARVTLWNLGWRDVIVWSSPIFPFSFFWTFFELWLHHGWTKSILFSSLGLKKTYF